MHVDTDRIKTGQYKFRVKAASSKAPGVGTSAFINVIAHLDKKDKKTGTEAMVYQDGTRFCAPTLECIHKEEDYIFNVSKGQFVGGSGGSAFMVVLVLILVFSCIGLCAQRYYYFKKVNELSD